MAKDPLYQGKDRAGKWLVSVKGDSILHLAGVTGFTSWKSVHSELVAPRRLPDGMIEANFPNEKKPRLYLVEFETYPDNSVDPQLFEDILLTRLEKKIVPEVICIVLKPKDNITVKGTHYETSQTGQVELSARWNVIEVWRFEMEELLARHEAGQIPWAALARFDGTIEERVRRCEEEIRLTTTPADREPIIVATAVMIQLLSGDDALASLLRGEMLLDNPEVQQAATTLFGPLIRETAEEMAHARITEAQAELINQSRQTLVRVLTARFGPPASDLLQRIETVSNLDLLQELIFIAAVRDDLTAFEGEFSRVTSPKSQP